MSLEALLADHTAALRENTAALREASAGREAAVAAITATGAAKAEPKPRGRPPGADKAAEHTAAKPADPVVAAAKTPPATVAAPTVDELRRVAGGYMNVAEPEKAARQDFIRSICAHLGVAKIVQADPADFGKIIAWVEAKADGKTVNFSEGEDGPVETEEDDIG